MPKIVHVVNSYFSATYFIGEQFRYFGSKGYEIHLVCPSSPYLKEYSARMGFACREVAITRGYTPLADFIAFFRILFYLIRIRPDIVTGHTVKGGLLAMTAARMARVPVRIYFRHGLAFETATGTGRRLLIISERVAAAFSGVVVSVSKSLAEMSLKYNLNPEWKQVVPGAGSCGGIDADTRFNPALIDRDVAGRLRHDLRISDDEYVIGYCGRIVRDKGIIELIEAFDILVRLRPEARFRLLLAGMFEDRDSIPEVMKERILRDNSIVYTGFINEKIEYYYSLMDVFVLPSYREGFPISVLEASSMQIPVITTNSTGSRDAIVGNITGLFTEIDPDTISSSILSLHDDTDLANRLGRNGREFVLSNFRHELIWPEIEKLYTRP